MRRKPINLNLQLSEQFDINVDSEISTKIRNIVINETYKAITHSFKNKHKKAEIAEINNTRAVINIPKNQWKPILSNKILPFFIKEEEYNKCAEIRDLINQL